MDYQKRLETVRQKMDQAGIDLMFLKRGANLFYLTGVRRQLEHQTDHHAFAEWITGALIGRDGGITLLSPRMGGSFYEREAVDKPWINKVRLVKEDEVPEEVLKQEIKQFPGSMHQVSVDDRAWAEALLALQASLPDASFSRASDLITPMRTIKSDEEIEAMRRAAEVTDAVFEQVIPFLRPGITEFDVAEEIEARFQQAGAEYLSFQTGIVFAGTEGGRVDGITRAKGSRTLNVGDSVTFDFGCVVDGYCSDFGRSAFIGEPPEEYRKIHNIVLDAQAEAIKAMKAGQITTAETNAIARKVIADAGYDEGFTHRLGHGIGVTVHEPPFLDVMDHTVLAENMVFTVEPSIRLTNSYTNRVEDCVRVTAAGGESLNKARHDLTIVE